MAKEITPFNIVEKPGFRSMVRKLDPRYEVPSRKYFSKIALPSLYSETCEKVTKELQEAEYYSVATDLWSSIGKLIPYLAVTIHYINQEWELKSCYLSNLFCSAAPSTKKRRLVNILCSAVCTTNSTQQAMSNEERVKEELSRYLENNQPEINTNPLEWWKHHNKDLPYLSTLSKKCLSVCTTSSPSDSQMQLSKA